MSRGRGSRGARVGILAVLLVAIALPLSGSAAGEESLEDLRARMDEIQAELDSTTARIEELRTRADELEGRIGAIETRMDELADQQQKLQGAAAARADELYRTGTVGMAEVLLTSDDFSELTTRVELLSQASLEDSGVFVRLSRAEAELRDLEAELSQREAELDEASQALAAENERLQAQFDSVSEEYERLRERLAALEPVTSSGAPATSSAPVQLKGTDGMFCPVAGPVSFVDSWGAPRSGHTHQGVDMMADYGTPIVAIVSGNITYSAYDGSGGNMIFLSGDDGHDYWYMHNQDNLVSGGHVRAGQQIATVGDTGNATGTPHLHFEYHPGRGAAVNPYPLVASIC